ncbi:MAG: hypothetical protein PHS80_08330 [Methanothrix sp.]|nr:hypothetical protein [Methanothrix sp.]MDD4447815.1 hypothetical protein [Methanothrix sp.]
MELEDLKKELDELKIAIQHTGTEFIMESKGICITYCVNGCQTSCEDGRQYGQCSASRENGD